MVRYVDKPRCAVRPRVLVSAGAHALGLLVVLVLASTASAAVAQIDDPVGDVPLSFNQVTDITRVSVSWDKTLRVAVTYKDEPRSTDVNLLVSEASKDELDPDVTECDPSLADSFTVSVTWQGATLSVPYVEGKLTSPSVRDGLTLTYEFAAKALTDAFAADRSDPFACVSGSADGDDFFGAFPGRTLKLSSRVAEETLSDELDRRFGSSFRTSSRWQVACPRSGFQAASEPSDSGPGMSARALCTFDFAAGRVLRRGSANVLLLGGKPTTTEFFVQRLDSAFRVCGTFGANGNGKLGWWDGPVFGYSLSVLARRTPCPSARRIARRWRGKPRVGRWRCKVTKRKYEYVAVRCTRPGGRMIRFESAV